MLCKKVEAIFSKYIPRTYTTAATLLDIFLLAYTLFTSDLAEPRNAEQLTNKKFFNFYNIL